MVISGGQTGVDYTALFVAREAGILTGGVAPKGYRTDEGDNPFLANFNLVEHRSRSYPPRTEANVLAADLTVLFGMMNSAGCRLTIKLCEKLGKPYLINPTVAELYTELYTRKVEVLNVAGNRQRTHPESAEQCRQILRRVFNVYDGSGLF